ncbi:uncharacterized protein G2W53_034121 [Senna tora]|uniref:Uncharacterized protein n=1 Tax=Senna tora TaxID=362788 RepID=A0A834SZV3_9FABA|nr:uncharacterized protein G2W53_034121 [Senna tora]
MRNLERVIVDHAPATNDEKAIRPRQRRSSNDPSDRSGAAATNEIQSVRQEGKIGEKMRGRGKTQKARDGQ